MKFFVPGTPVPKGSAKGFVIPGTNRCSIIQTNRDRQKPWASLISWTAQQQREPMIAGAVKLEMVFVMPRPKGHYRSGKNTGVLKPTAPLWHTSKPDIDKTSRLVLDALTGIVYKDDSQVTSVSAVKIYGELPGVQIEATALGLERMEEWVCL